MRNTALAERRLRSASVGQNDIDLDIALDIALREVGPSRALRKARLLSLAALAVVLTLLARGGVAAYYAFTDAFVAPLSLSSDSETVLQSKLTLSRLLSERQALLARIDENDASIQAAQTAVRLLGELKATSSTGVRWATEVAGGQTTHRVADLDKLATQRGVLLETLTRQERYVADLEKSLAAGLIHKADLEQAQNAVNQTKVALVENDREQLTARAQLKGAALARQALSGARNISTPEMLAERQQLARIQMDISKYEAEGRTRDAQQRADRESLARIDELLAQMKARPIFRAIETSQNLAFVTYKEIDGVQAGGMVYRCAVWGFVGCERVGTVSEVLPGEVTMQDPWGTAARGQYAVLDLSDATAARSRTLRVRSPGSGGGAEMAVSSR